MAGRFLPIAKARGIHGQRGRMKYGITFKGSKSRIANKLCHIFPKATNFYDLFGGGAAILHYMCVNRWYDYDNIFYNEKDKVVFDLVKDGIDGKYNKNTFKPHWVSRDDFHKFKNIDGYAAYLFSFGANGSTYFCNKNIEKIHESCFKAAAEDVYGEAYHLKEEEGGEIKKIPQHITDI